MAFTEIQLNFLLSMSANAASSLSGSNLGSKALPLIQARLDELDGDWEVAWGPGIYQVKPGVSPTNVMYVAHSPWRQEYFIAIAGTNPNSLYSWICQDFYVSKTVAWPYGSPGKGVAISTGTMNGLQALQGMVPEPSLPGAGLKLYDWLKQLAAQGKPFDLSTGGHSLGGALSPTALLWLVDTVADWDPQGMVTEYATWPFAGPTAGVKAFASYSDQRIPGTHRTYNQIDIVPQAWEADTMAALPAIYDPDIPASTFIANVLYVASLLPLWHEYQQINNNDTPLKGAVNQSLIGPDPTKNYLVQAVYQHVSAYYELLGLQSYTPQEATEALEAAKASPVEELEKRVKAYLGLKDSLEKEKAAAEGKS